MLDDAAKMFYSLRQKSVDSREEEQVLSDFSPLRHVFQILSLKQAHSTASYSPGI